MTIPNLTPAAVKKTEWKVRAASLATFLSSLAGTVALTTTASDLVHALPDWLETILYPSLLAATTWVSGRAARSRPEYLSESTVQAVEDWLRKRAPRYPR